MLQLPGLHIVRLPLSLTPTSTPPPQPTPPLPYEFHLTKTLTKQFKDYHPCLRNNDSYTQTNVAHDAVNNVRRCQIQSIGVRAVDVGLFFIMQTDLRVSILSD